MERSPYQYAGNSNEVEARGSQGERQIARMLQRYGVRYFYEHPVAVVDRGKVRVWYSDFWLPDYAVAVEYNGVVQDMAYAEGVEHKKAVYEAMGIPCVYLDAEALKGCWPSRVMGEVREKLEERLERFDELMEHRSIGGAYEEQA